MSTVGAIAGLGVTLGFGRVLEGWLYGVRSTDAPTLLAVVSVVLAVTITASVMPALRAARTEPMQVLREE